MLPQIHKKKPADDGKHVYTTLVKQSFGPKRFTKVSTPFSHLS